ncbi:aldo/keto reductase [Actinocatenispora rupis]|uniref:Aldo/keto reductase n=1 Tax=Actinocatenispora rupis TaxID=519421 RepID=A0A8J3JA41_9ACTN|nr:aldo/keto reductase [Actinocatenispora rupis]GID12867.1 aldo/keto reductase [Actinocatenispora rupis]
MTGLPHRRIGTVEVPAIGLGCMGMSEFYGPADDDASVALIHEALDSGVRLLDTADMYGAGHNERLVGRALAGRRDDAVLATKFAIRRDEAGNRSLDSTPEYAKRAVDASLSRLGVDTIDLYYMHRWDGVTPIEETVGALAELVAAGKIRQIGLSEVNADLLRRAAAVHPIAALQSELSLWTRDVLDNGVLATAAELGTTLVAYSPLGRGFLTGAVSSVTNLAPDDFRRTNPRFADGNLEANLAMLAEVRRVAEAHDVPPSRVALAWVLAQGDNVVAIPGTRRSKYLQDNVAAADLALSAADLAALDAAFAPERIAGERYVPAGMPKQG